MNTFFLGLATLLVIYLGSILILIQTKHDTSIANFTWGGGCMLVSVYTIIFFKNFQHRPLLLTSLIVIWCLRLIHYLYVRYTGKDPRFEKWKLQGTKAFIINLGYIFIAQLFLLVIMSVPAYLVNTTIVQPPLGILDYLGLIVWIFGICFEAISDYQLFNFLKNPVNKGHVMNLGLWRYSRHPNYFGEATLWWGVFLIAVNVQHGIISIIAPLTITILLRFFTGVPLLENAMKDNVEYQEYKKHTSIFIPWFVK